MITKLPSWSSTIDKTQMFALAGARWPAVGLSDVPYEGAECVRQLRQRDEREGRAQRSPGELHDVPGLGGVGGQPQRAT